MADMRKTRKKSARELREESLVLMQTVSFTFEEMELERADDDGMIDRRVVE